MNKLKTFDSNYFVGKSHFDEDGTQNYLAFQPIIRYFQVNTITNTNYVSSWKSKGLSAETISKDCSVDYMKKTGFNGYVYDFSVDYNVTDVDDIKDIHKYLMKKNNNYSIKCLDLLKSVFLLGHCFYRA